MEAGDTLFTGDAHKSGEDDDGEVDADMHNHAHMPFSRSFRSFVIIWFGQFVSIIGSGLSSFACSVWILETTHSALTFAVSLVIYQLPALVISPIAGSLADRRSRKAVMMLADTGDACVKLILAFCWFTHHLELNYVYAALCLSSVFNTLQTPAFSASIPCLVAKDQLNRANGMMQGIRSVKVMAVPLLAGMLYPIIHMGGLLMIDVATYIIGIFTLASQSIAQPAFERKPLHSRQIVTDLHAAALYLWHKQGFVSLIVLFAVLNFVVNVALVSIPAMVIALHGAAIYGMVNAISGCAMVISSVVMMVVSPHSKRIQAILIGLLVSALGLMVMSVSPLWYIIAGGFFLFALPVPVVSAYMQSITQTKISGEILGRASALQKMIVTGAAPLAYVLSGYLTDYVFNPLLVDGGAWSNSFIAAVFGTGPARGTGVILFLCGLVLVLVGIGSHANKRLMTLERTNPDVIGDDGYEPRQSCSETTTCLKTRDAQ